jgi:hypothetical protein
MATTRAGSAGSPTRRRSVLTRVLATPFAGAVVLLAGLGFLLGPVSTATAGALPPAQGWTSTEAPLPADAGNGSTNPHVYLASTSCPSTSGCVAAGWYSDTAGQVWGLIEQQSGSGWNVIEAPQPANAGTGANQGLWLGSSGCGLSSPCRAVSCPTASFCVAVGQYQITTTDNAAVIETLSGGSWTAMQAPVPGDAAAGPSPQPFAALQSVWCASPTSCVAVGSYVNASGNTAGFIDTLSGTTWATATTPVPSDAAGTLSDLKGVSCPTASSCVATGTYRTTAGGIDGLFAMLAGSTWTASAAPAATNAATGASQVTQPFQVACASAASCVVAGQYTDTGGNHPGYIATLSGGTWSAIAAPVPSDAATGGPGLSTVLYGASCGAPTVCTVVGWYPDTGGGQHGLIDTLSGSSWSTQAAPVPANAAPGSVSTQLQTVSCPTPAFCTAVGYYQTAGPVTTGLVDTLVGGSWRAMTAPVPSNATATTNYLSNAKYVDCYSPVACNVVGGYTDAASNNQGFLATFTGLQGYWLDASDGGIFAYPNAGFFGSRGGQPLNQPMVGMAATTDGQGYWLVASDGGIFSYGDAGFFGSRGGQPLNKPIVGMTATPDSKGYWFVASDGGIFAYGDAGFYGSRGGQPLNKPIVGMAATPSGKGYWLVASDGGIFSYGDAAFYGSTGSMVLNKPVVGMASSATGLGYWLVAADGGIFSYGDAAFYGSTGSLVLNKPVVGMAASPSGKGYWFVASDGGIFNYGDAPFNGSAGSLVLNKPVVGMAAG